jgi:hypothetical protein
MWTIKSLLVASLVIFIGYCLVKAAEGIADYLDGKDRGEDK